MIKSKHIVSNFDWNVSTPTAFTILKMFVMQPKNANEIKRGRRFSINEMRMKLRKLIKYNLKPLHYNN
jgi:hypothetical protein